MRRTLAASRLVVPAVVAAACGQLPSAVPPPPPPAAVAPVPRPPAPAPEAPTRPNVLLIVTDDQPLGTLGVMPQVRRWFVERGTTFPRAVVTTPLCCPSRATILTGRYAHNHGVVGNNQGPRLDPRSVLSVVLRRAGYRTAMTGKLFNRWPPELPPPGFERWALSNGGYRNALFNVNGVLRSVQRYSTNFVAERAVGFLRWFERHDADPWFLLVAPYAPHGPFVPAHRYAGAPVPEWRPGPEVGERNVADKPPHVAARKTDPAASEAIRAGQLRTLMSVDDLVGRVMDELGALDERRDTLAVYVSDNGYLWGQHRIVHGKRVPYLPSVRVPLLMRWPGHLRSGATDHRLAANVDLAPTILEAAGFRRGLARLDGRSLLRNHRRGGILLEHWESDGRPIPTWASLLTRRYQYIETYAADGTTVTFREYYDLVRDPAQLRNLLADGDAANDPPPGRLAKLSRDLEAARVCRGSAGPGACR